MDTALGAGGVDRRVPATAPGQTGRPRALPQKSARAAGSAEPMVRLEVRWPPGGRCRRWAAMARGAGRRMIVASPGFRGSWRSAFRCVMSGPGRPGGVGGDDGLAGVVGGFD